MKQVQTDFKIIHQFSDQKIRSPINAIDLEQRGKRFIVGCTDNGFYFLFDTFSFECKELRSISHPTIITDISWSRMDNSVFASTAYDKIVRLYNANSPRASIQKYTLGTFGHSITFHPSDPIIAVSLDKGGVRIIDIRDPNDFQTYTTGFDNNVLPVEWYPLHSTKNILCGDDAGRIFAFDISGSSQKYIFSMNKDSVLDEDYYPAHDSPLVGLRFSPNKHEFLSLDSNGIIRSWDSDTGLALLKESRVEVPNAKSILRLRKLAFMGNHLLVPETNGVVDIENETKFVGHIDAVTAVVTSDIGLVTAAKDGYVNIWRKKEFISYVEDHSDWSD